MEVMTNWKNQNNTLQKTFEFADFQAAVEFMNQVAAIAQRMNHHPQIQNMYNKVTLHLSTHDAGDVVTEKDKAFAAEVDELFTVEERPKPTTLKKVKMFADGGSRGNPGPSASGFVLLDEHDNVVVEQGVYLGITTNNQAEYQAVKFGLEMAKKMNIQEVDVYLDSLLVVNQMNGIFKIRNRDLWPIHQAIKELVQGFKHVKFTHVPREYNKLADAEVNKVLDNEAKKQ